MNHFILLLLCVIPCIFCDLQIYLSPNGSDSTGDGSQQNPFQTIVQAVIESNSQPGAPVQLFFSPGLYVVASGFDPVFNAPLNASYLDDGTGQNVTISCSFNMFGLVTQNQDLIVSGANKMVISGCSIAIGIMSRPVGSANLMIDSVMTSYSTGNTLLAEYVNVNINQATIQAGTGQPFAFENSNVTITNSTFSAPSIDACGQIRAGSTATVTNSTFSGICMFVAADGFSKNSLYVNSSVFINSSVRSEDVDIVIDNSQFFNGRESTLDLEEGTLLLTNSTIHDITGSTYGALYLQELSNVTISECSFFKNQGNQGGSIFINGSPHFLVSNTTFFNNTAVVNGSAIYCDFEDNYNTTLSNYQNVTLAGNNTRDPIVCPGFVYPANYFEDESNNDDENAADEPNDLTWLWIVLGVVGGLVVIALIVGAAVVVIKKRRESYKEIL